MSNETPWYLRPAKAVDEASIVAATERQNNLTKPPGSLGRLEEVAIQLAGLQGKPFPSCNEVTIAVFAGDHGVAEEGVSAFPQAVTVEMIKNFVNGGAAISVLARALGASLMVVNAGAATENSFDSPVWDLPVGLGTKNFTKDAAMSVSELENALSLGANIIDDVISQGCELFIGGEMGIANTTSATALGCRYTGLPIQDLVGPGTGISAEGISHKQKVIQQAFDFHGQDDNPLQTLQRFGGFEIAALSGAMLAAAQQGLPILVDGFIVTAAALAAVKINPSIQPWLLFSHGSAEPGHQKLLQHLNAKPLVDLNLRLGEGSGAATVVPLLRIACALHGGMATFAEAGISSE